MVRDLSTDFETQADSSQSRSIEIYDVFLGSQTECDSSTYHWCGYSYTISFFLPLSPYTAQNYSPLGIKRSTIKHNIDLAVDYFNAEYCNVDRAMAAFVASTDFRDKRVIVRKVFLDALSSVDDGTILFDGVMDKPLVKEDTLSLQIVSRLDLKKRTGRIYSILCNWKFGDDYCTFPRSSTAQINQTIDSGTTATMITDASRSETDDYWKDGIIEVLSGSASGDKRRVTTSDQSARTLTLDFSLSETPSAGDLYSVWQGCDKTKHICKGKFHNTINFGGFHAIPQEIPEQMGG